MNTKFSIDEMCWDKEDKCIRTVREINVDNCKKIFYKAVDDRYFLAEHPFLPENRLEKLTLSRKRQVYKEREEETAKNRSEMLLELRKMLGLNEFLEEMK